MVNLCLKSYTFGIFFILYWYLNVWIRIWIHLAPEYGSEPTTLVLCAKYSTLSVIY